ncbi:MAG: hypothetical protein JSS23_12300 [Proteobacteria bacterium]|nr:hypothetical protein [Pseudomonadota bacterium]
MTITDKTMVSLSLAGVLALVWGGWACANFVRDIRDEVRVGLADTRHEIEALKRENAARFGALWTTEDQQEWIWLFQDKNRESRVIVPTVRDVRAANPAK